MLDAIRSRLSAAGLDRVAPGILELTRPAVRLGTRRAAQTRQPVGSSRIGGTPALRERRFDAAWMILQCS